VAPNKKPAEGGVFIHSFYPGLTGKRPPPLPTDVSTAGSPHPEALLKFAPHMSDTAFMNAVHELIYDL
jgi:hypothetical protein